MRISTLCNICYIVVSCELLLYVFLQKLLHYLNKFTNRHRSVCLTDSLNALKWHFSNDNNQDFF